MVQALYVGPERELLSRRERGEIRAGERAQVAAELGQPAERIIFYRPFRGDMLLGHAIEDGVVERLRGGRYGMKQRRHGGPPYRDDPDLAGV